MFDVQRESDSAESVEIKSASLLVMSWLGHLTKCLFI